MDLKNVPSHIPLNQERSQTDGTKFRQNLIPESISWPMWVSQCNSGPGFGKNGMCMRPKTQLFMYTSILNYHNPLKLRSELGIPSYSELGTLQSQQQLIRTTFEPVVGHPADVGTLAHYTLSFSCNSSSILSKTG